MIEIRENLNFKNILNELGVTEEKISENILELFSETGEFDILYDTIRAVLTRKKHSVHFVREVMLCLDEAFSNAIVWGNGNDAGKKVTVKYYINRYFCVIHMMDQGQGFDVSRLVWSLACDMPISMHVRGLYFINKYIDRVFFNSKGNEILLVKYNNTSNGD